jgi:hypothetical protein
MLSPIFNNDKRDSDICRIVEEAIVLEQSYKELLLQGDEVNQRIRLWRDAIELCKTNHICTSYIFA